MEKEKGAKTEEPKDSEWPGFKPIPYHLDFQKVMALKLEKIDPENDDKKLASLTIKEILEALDLDHIKEVSAIVSNVEVETAKGKSAYRGEPFANSVLAFVLRLLSKSAHPFSCQLYWFDSDSCMDDPHETYHFFVVHGDKIVEENTGFSEFPRSGFDPTAFVHHGDSKVWMHEDDWMAARTSLWYRRFYEETTTGRLMRFRPDKPKLFYFPDGHIEVGIEEDDDRATPNQFEAILRELKSLRTTTQLLAWIIAFIGGMLLFRK